MNRVIKIVNRTISEGDTGLEDGEVGEIQNVIVQARVIEPSERQGGMRLNAAMKQEVIDAAMKHGYDERRKALIKRENALARLAWIACFGEAAIKHARALGPAFVLEGVDRYGQQLPEGVPVTYTFNGYSFNLRTLLPIPVHGGFSDHKYLRIKDAKLEAAVRELYDVMQTFEAERVKTLNTLSAMLQRITTYPSLEKNWPAGVKFYKHLPKKYPFRHQVPAVMVDQLNAALGI